MPPDRQRLNRDSWNLSWQRVNRRLSLALALSTIQVTERFGSIQSQFRWRTLWGDKRHPTSLPLPPTSRERTCGSTAV
ncbi:hypothetical protein TNCV_1732461 [Trichonephila clavipes]|nr:hypothetical protein TNCV_1732461 [Trichonephila clavipes]